MQPKKNKPKTPTVSASGATYKTLRVFEGVVIKVPGKSSTMNYESADAEMSEHWQSKNGLGEGVFLYMNFFHITKVNLATKIVATVTVKKAIDSEGVEVTVLDVEHTPEEDCQFTYHVFSDGRGDIEIDSRIPQRIQFEPRKHNKLRL